MIDVPSVVRFCSTHRVSFEQFMLCYLLHQYRLEEEIGEHIYETKDASLNSVAVKITEYTEAARPWTNNEIDRLVEKGLLIDESKGQHRYPEDFRPTKLFIDNFLTDRLRFERFWDLYPGLVANFHDPRLAKIQLRGVPKEEIEALFFKRVPSLAMYERLMVATLWAKEQKLITIRIDKWLSGEVWKDFENEMLNKTSGDTGHSVVL